MKILTKEEEDAHYSAVLKGGSVGGFIGLAAGLAGVLAASKRYHTIRTLTLPMKSFLVTSSGTFCGIIAADHSSRSFEAQRNANKQWYENREKRLHEEEMSGMSLTERVMAFARRERYKIVGATWVASMVGSFALVGRNPYLTGQQKIVQARVYAQGLTLAVLCASAAFEISDQRKGRGIIEASKKSKEAAKKVEAEASEQGDLWKDMVAAEEDRLKKKQQSLYGKHDKVKEQQQPEQPQENSDAPKTQPKESSKEPEKQSQK